MAPRYEALRPEGATVSRLALTVAEYGYDGLVVRASPETVDRIRARAAEVPQSVGIAIELEPADRQEASGAVGHYRSDADLLLLRGGTPDLNRFAVEDPRVDVLTAPMAESGDVNHVIAGAAAENGVAIELNLGPVLRTSGGRRVRAIRDRRKLIELVADADAPWVASADATDHLQVRAPRELCALGDVIGVGADVIETGLAAWHRLLERTRRRRDPSFVEPGVRRGRPEEES